MPSLDTKTITRVDINQFFTEFTPSKCNIRVSSKLVAEHFGKRHADILRAIDNLECSQEFTKHNFAFSEYKDSTGRKLPEILMTEKGFNFLVLGFTGKKAARYKEAYIEAFDKLKQFYLKRLRRHQRAETKSMLTSKHSLKVAGKSEAQIRREERRTYKEEYDDTVEDLCSLFNV